MGWDGMGWDGMGWDGMGMCKEQADGTRGHVTSLTQVCSREGSKFTRLQGSGEACLARWCSAHS